MKAITYMKKMKEQGYTNIQQTEGLTRALHREGKLDASQVVRFSLLYGKFDIVNADYFQTGEFNPALCNSGWLTIDELMDYFS